MTIYSRTIRRSFAYSPGVRGFISRYVRLNSTRLQLRESGERLDYHSIDYSNVY